MPSPTRRYYSSNAVSTTISSAINNTATSIIVASVTGWPTSYPFTAIIGEDTTKEEIVTVSNVSGSTLTISSRGVAGTSAQSHDAGETIRHGIYSQDFEDGAAHYAASSAVHGVTGSVVGTTDTQTLTNKTINGSSNTLSNIPSSAISGVTGSVVGTTATQTLTNKTISGSSNTLSNIPSSAISGITGSVVGTSDAQTLTNKTISGSSNTLSAIPVSALTGSNWSAWTPTWTGLTIGNATVEARYSNIGKVVSFELRVVFGTTTALTTTTTQFTLPATAATGVARRQFNGFWVTYGGAANVPIVADTISSATAATVYWRDSLTSISAFNSSTTSGFYWGSGNVILISGTYEAA